MKWFATIKSELNKLSFYRSLKFRISLLIVLTGLISCSVMRFGILQSYYNRAVEVRVGDVQNQMKILADHLLSYHYLQEPQSDLLNVELEQFSTIYDGRILIINDSLTIIRDTYNINQGKTIIAEDVIRCFKGESIYNLDEDNGYIELTVPIQQVTDDKSQTVGVIYASLSTAGIDANYDILNRNGLLMSTLMFFAVCLLAMMVPRLMLKPFDRMTDAINDMKAGFADDLIAVNDYTETEHIVDAFNHLLERMKVLDDSRQEFVSNVSHELKTPMTSIKVLADSLNTQEDVPIELYKEFMTDIVDEIDRENKIINDLLALVKLDKSASNLNIETVNINNLFGSVFKRLKPLANEKNIELVFQSQREVVAEVDEVKLSLAITNLIENGIKYNHEEGWVNVILDADHQFFTFEVSDSGIGISEDDQKHIFERFYRVDKSHSREIGGTGLGLAITKSTVIKHRGTITVESTPEEGTTFVVKIPLSYILQERTEKTE